MTSTETLPTRLEAAELAELMSSMNQVAQRLADTHSHLQTQVASLQAELAEANEQLRRSRSLAALGEMAAGIAHELRNPLGCLALFGQVLLEDLSDSPRHLETCRKMMTAVKRMDAVVTDVLTFARDMAITPTDTTTAELFDRALTDCEGLLKAEGVSVVHQTPDATLRVSADRGLLVSVLSNLIRNAVEAMVEAKAPQRRLTLSAVRESRRCPDGRRATRVVLAVSDTGPGVPAEARSRIFNPFYTTRENGTGLGLAIVHRIVDAHGGHLAVTDADTGGARFEVCLPVRAAGDRPRRAAVDSGASLSGAVSRRLSRERAA
jgi:signal transduction histidine kinase